MASFGLEVDGVFLTNLTEVSGLRPEQDGIEVKQNTADGKYLVKKLPGRPKAGEIIITRDRAAAGRFPERIGNGAIVVYDDAGQVLKRYRITGAAVKAAGTDALTEKLIISYEQLEVE